MERLQKLISQAGAASRREAERLIESGRVTVNGKKAILGQQADIKDKIAIDGVLIGAKAKKLYFILNKPKGYICSVKDDRGRRTVLDLLPDVKEYIYPVGRLDYNTEGLLILTNDGELMNGLLHPSREVFKTYVAKAKGIINDEELHKLADGVMLDDGMTAPADVRLLDVGRGKDSWSRVELSIHEGRNRQVRRMLAAAGHEVIALKRVSFAGLTLNNLPRGSYRKLTEREVVYLKGFYK